MTARADDLPLYVRTLRLRHLRPSGAQCFLFFEAMIAVGGLLALAELVPWWGVFALPTVVAAMVKINDLIAATTARVGRRGRAADDGVADDGAGGLALHAVAGRSPAVRWRLLDDRRTPARKLASGAVPGAVPGDGYPRAIGRATVRPPAGVGTRPATPADENTTLGLAHALNALPVAGSVDSPEQRARQSAVRRYE